MRIIDSNHDFYDFYQNIYRDNSIVFDRRDSYNLTKEEFAKRFYYDGCVNGWRDSVSENKNILLQICNTFWLFNLCVTKTDSFGMCTDYEIKLLNTWKNYNKPAQIIYLSQIRFPYYIKDGIESRVSAVDSADYKTVCEFNEFVISREFKHDYVRETRHIPILCNIGIAKEVEALDVYLALEEYFSTKKTETERTESVGLTNDEKVTNHGFDIKKSFRGKQ